MRTNVARSSQPVRTHEGARAQRVSPLEELRRAVSTCLLWEGSFYEKGNATAARIAALIPQCDPAKVAALAVEARTAMHLRHVPLFLAVQLAQAKKLTAATVTAIVQRPDDMAELLALYWKDGRKPVAASIKRGLAASFAKFNAYQLAKWNRDGAVKLRDVLFLTHAKPRDAEQAAVFKQLTDKTLAPPDTWEVELSAGKDKRETWERLLREQKLGGIATLMNLRNMLSVNVDRGLIRERLAGKFPRALPFRFITAARYAPDLEPHIEEAMLRAVDEIAALPGETGLLIDVSGSMNYRLSDKSELTRIDAAAALAILLREKCAAVRVATFSEDVCVIPPRRGFALRDAIEESQPHGGTYLRGALTALQMQGGWGELDRIIVVTDEQSHDGIAANWCKAGYVVNVASYERGVGYGNGWTHINGWSEGVLAYVQACESPAE